MQGSFKMDLSALGQPELEAKINALPGMVAKRLVASSIRTGGKILLAAVEAAVPRDTTALAKSLRKTSATFGRGMIQMRIYTGDFEKLGYRKTKKLGARGGRGVQGYPPAAIEFGYLRGGKHARHEFREDIVDRLGRKRNVRRVVHSTTGGERVAPRSFMRAPLEAVRAEVTEAIGKDLWEGLEELASEAEPK